MIPPDPDHAPNARAGPAKAHDYCCIVTTPGQLADIDLRRLAPTRFTLLRSVKRHEPWGPHYTRGRQGA